MGLTSQDEDCLSLNIWVPTGERPARPLPVVVWLHGGAFVAGAGSQAWYDGARLAAGLGVVVVTVNYRLGVLGFLHLAGEVPANLGLLDQVAALRWVRANIAAFGGDPARVTVAGQSAGAHSILAMLHDGRWPDGCSGARSSRVHRWGCGRLRRSRPTGVPGSCSRSSTPRPPDSGTCRWPRSSLPRTPSSGGRGAHFQLGPAFQLVADDVTVPADLLTPTASDVTVAVTATEHEADAFTVPDPRVRAMPLADVRTALRLVLGESTDERVAEQSQRDAGATPARLASDLVTRSARGILEPLVQHIRGQGVPVGTDRFTWHPPGSPFRAAHCIDLPFTFDTVDAWRDSPLLRGVGVDRLRERAHSLRSLRHDLLWNGTDDRP